MKGELIKEQLRWDIKVGPVMVGKSKADNYQGIVRSDNGSIISIMKNSYSPLTNKEFLDITKKMSETTKFGVKGFVDFRGGRRVVAYLENTKGNIKIGDHPIKDYMILGNSFDGSTPFVIGTTSILIRCQNQFTRLFRELKDNQLAKIRHTGTKDVKIQELLQYVEQYYSGRDEMYRNFEKMRKVKIDDKIRNEMLDMILKIDDRTGISTRKENTLKEVENAIKKETSVLGNNLWGLFNGITYYTTHEVDSKTKVFGNVFGKVARYNEGAYQYALQHIS